MGIVFAEFDVKIMIVAIIGEEYKIIRYIIVLLDNVGAKSSLKFCVFYHVLHGAVDKFVLYSVKIRSKIRFVKKLDY